MEAELVNNVKKVAHQDSCACVCQAVIVEHVSQGAIGVGKAISCTAKFEVFLRRDALFYIATGALVVRDPVPSVEQSREWPSHHNLGVFSEDFARMQKSFNDAGQMMTFLHICSSQ